MESFHDMNEEELKSAARKYNSIYLNKHSLDAATVSCGTVVELTNQVLTGKLDNAVANCSTIWILC